MAKKIVANIKMRVPAGKATPAPPVGSILGQYGVNMMDFINPFNEQTRDMQGSLPVHVTIYEDRSFTFIVKGQPTDDLIREKLGIDKASGEPNKTKVGKLTAQQVAEIAEVKLVDMNTDDLEAAKRVVAGSARSMGVEVEK
ncbi:MAG: 50S ribosomal protein L11 [Candidatus Saccharimonadales bacterium]